MKYARDGFSVEAARKKGRPLPLWYTNREQPVEYEGFYLQAFFDLSTTRQIGECPGPIPWDKIIMYSDRCGLEKDVEAFFCRVLRSMDAAYLEHTTQEVKNRKPIKKGK